MNFIIICASFCAASAQAAIDECLSDGMCGMNLLQMDLDRPPRAHDLVLAEENQSKLSRPVLAAPNHSQLLHPQVLAAANHSQLPLRQDLAAGNHSQLPHPQVLATANHSHLPHPQVLAAGKLPKHSAALVSTARTSEGTATAIIFASGIFICILCGVASWYAENPQIFWCSFFAVGIVLTLLIYGVQQERIMSQPYGDAMFQDSVFLVFCNRFCAIFFSAAMLAHQREEWKMQAPLWSYLVISFSNVLASTCQYEALKYVSFPTQMLGKSFKMMPVMLWGMAISGKKFGVKDWVVAFFVTAGVTEFLLTGPISSSDDTSDSLKGLFLLLGFLAFDGITSPMQEKVFKEYKTSKYNVLFYVNFFSAITTAVTLVTSGSISTALGFCVDHPTFIWDAATLSGSQVASQWFIYSQIHEFGALVFAATMNVRQVVSIVNSYLEFGNAITYLQVLGLLLIFGALFWKSYDGLTAKRAAK